MGDPADPAPEAEVVVRHSVHFLCQRCISRGVRPLDCSLRVSGSLYNLHTHTITQPAPEQGSSQGGGADMDIFN